ncbi:MAG: CxxxxCH/CxxCH domain-containing protein [Deltaproteobacteria bacterium]|nr:CxxxxCH/CxxCH domain-containing protein [Deltaproteobacteria bacterium]
MGRSLRWLAAVVLVSQVGCTDDEVPNDDDPNDGCRTCHGSRANAAPPKALDGATETSARGVGSHQTHVLGLRLKRPVACEECHVRPAKVDDPGHIDSTPGAELTFGALARGDGATPAFDGAQLTCTNYCHGATMSGGTTTRPLWTSVDGSQSDCRSCHGMPPLPPHPAAADCSLCHDTVAPDQTLRAPERHADGRVDVSDIEACSSCHGSDLNPAPPKDLSGKSETASLGVGAHQTHLGGGASSRAVPCASCHLVPTELNTAGHVDSSPPAELTFSGLSGLRGATTGWDRATATCSDSYCHGSKLEGAATRAAPAWTRVDGTEAKCGSCHGLPPADPHPPNDRCELCHLPTAGPNRTIANRERHVNGVVEVAVDGCTGCHGSATNLAPPKDMEGRSDTTLRSVGAHQTHVTGGRSSLPVPCDACHHVPGALDETGHRDTPPPAEVSFSGLATSGGATPAWDGATCGNTYCHTLSSTAGGSLVTPTWTRVDGSEAACGSCHGLPPPSPHPESRACALCHGPTAGPALTIANPATHVDGIVQKTDGQCATCHGSGAQPAPPKDLAGRADPTVITVGAHRAHVEGVSGISRPVACTECHLVPATLSSPGHVDTDPPAELSFGPLAATAGATPSFDEATATCASVYCHGATLDAGRASVPLWTRTDGSQTHCSGCHGFPPGGDHPRDDRCSLCHLPTASVDGIGDPTTHIDGRLQVSKDCDSCHGSAGESAPPRDLDGRSETTRISVGAHRTHLDGGKTGKPVACTECHVVPEELDNPGHVDTARPAELVFGNLAGLGHRPAWAAPTCGDTYCHNGVGAIVPAPAWNVVDGTQGDCGGCHAIPPATPVHQGSADCSNCHLPTAGPNRTIAEPSRHVDGSLDVTDLDCNSCHGDVDSPAPPRDLAGHTDATDEQVGAHRAHLGGNRSARVACATCHLVPLHRDDPGHVDSDPPAELQFSGRATALGSVPSYSNGSCSETYCHAGSGASNPEPTWNVPGPLECGACHGLPPRAPHPQRAACETCHGEIVAADRSIIAPARHVDGVVDVDTSRCDSCHGSASNAAPPRDLDSRTNVTELTVGAHQAHLSGGQQSRAVRCEECHVVPAALADRGHIDSAAPAELVFGALSSKDAAPSFDRSVATCGSTYCHGDVSPAWTNPGTAPCGSCHALPPPAPHPRGDRCELCHLPTAAPSQRITSRDTHVDGIVQAAVEGCQGCHGTESNLAPPSDTLDRADPTLRTVGAHQVHLAGGRSSRPVACTECHVVPTGVDDAGHADTPAPAELTFGSVATAGAHVPVWNGTSCADSYCHNGSGAQKPTPVWTSSGGSEAACGACHGLPPPAPHPQNDRCALCHAPTAGPNKTIADRATHVNGLLEVTSGDCAACHGSPTSPAPPYDLSLGSDPTIRTVGAHRAHLEAPSRIAPPVPCSECHVVPTELDSPGHVDSPSPAEVHLGALSSISGVPASYDVLDATCETYCHGLSLDRPTPPPEWTQADGSERACGACHGVPPTVAHPLDDRCELCHLPTAGPNLTIADPSTHIDGVVQAATGCDGCHGQNGSSAPPIDLDHLSDPTRRGVGAHQTHLSGGVSGRPVACTECHAVPAELDSPGHIDTVRPAEVSFGPVSTSRSFTPAWTAPTCGSTECHAGVGASNPSPMWTVVDGTEAACGSCHAVPPNTPVHRSATDCVSCHLPTAGPNRTVANRATHVDGIVQVTSLDCNSCHGDTQSPAPPRDLAGDLVPTDAQVGSHRAHLEGGVSSAPVPCATCHLVPAQTDDPGHLEPPAPAEVIFSGLAAAGGETPSYNSGSCGSTHCHTGSGASNPTPRWNAPGSAPCGSCHGLPPPAPHPASNDCTLCHSPVAGPGQSIAVRARHGDGHLDVIDTSCDRCHGSTASPAPPADLAGLADPTTVTVGAHQAHLAGGLASRPVACDQCHLVPAELNSPGHVDTPAPAELTFGGLAKADGHNPSFDRTRATCANSYCHGEGNAVWTSPGAAVCGSCHGVPPSSPHPANDRCELCHLPTAGPNQTVANRLTHVDGTLQVAIDGCEGCHGTRSNLAPPVDTLGRSDISLRTVGAHQTHLSGGHGSRPVNCAECHFVPTNVADPGHNDTPAPAELNFGAVAKADGHTPIWDGTSCADSYCHNGSGAQKPTPGWTSSGGSEAACGACHGLPPPAPHPQNDQCAMCHAPTAGPNKTVADRTTHVNGFLDVTSGDCADCHGSPASPAPPVDLLGRSDSTLQTVGAHRTHIMGPSGISRPIACNECHLVPVELQSPGHIDTASPAEVRFGALASSGDLSPSYDPTTATCQEYCHGSTLDRSGPEPAWTTTGGLENACGACHGIPPTIRHPLDDRCELCHLPTAGPNQTIADATTHIDGILQAIAGCDGCHGQSGNSAPPYDLDRATTTTKVTIGAHQTHLAGGASSRPVACTECHIVPSELGAPGHVDTARPAELTFGGIATVAGHTPAWTSPTCANTACHAGDGASNPRPTWNVVDGTEAACGSCHGIPPSTPVHRSAADCSTCHLPTSGPSRTIANRASHVNGLVEVTSLDCSSCHGDAGSSAPPVDLDGQTATTDPQVGAHRVHLGGGASSAPVPCPTCHLVPTQTDDPGHLDTAAPAEIVFSGRAVVGGSPAGYSAGTCGTTYCHAGSGATNPAPRWSSPGSVQCGSCHGLPPPAPHPAQDACETCHAPVAGAGQTIANRALHADGHLDVVDASCDRCHGSPANDAPPRDLSGSADTREVTVGAHQTHLVGGLSSKVVQCAECHLVPAGLDSPGHVDTPLPAELTFGALARTAGASPAWDRGSESCSNSYCHGATMGQDVPPVWTLVDGTQAACGSCHGLPPAAPHPPNDRCELCHLPTAGPNQTVANRQTHVDGTLEVAIDGCVGCHGNDEVLSPPLDTQGRSEPSLRSVGAHQTHILGGQASKPVECSACHLVPSAVGDPGHSDTPLPAEVTFSGVARAGGAAPSWVTASVTCASTYCHGATLTGGAHRTPTWTTVDGSEASCGSCHGLPPPAPHPVSDRCGLCHAPTAGTGATIANPSTHVDGILQVTEGDCQSCHGSAANPAPPFDTSGRSLETLRTVGAHQAHLDAESGITRPVACTECHFVPNAANDPGHLDTPAPAEIRFGPLAAHGVTPVWNGIECSNTYCHGATLRDGATTQPVWTVVNGTQDGCGSCHGVPPGGSHPNDTRCELCHLPTAGANRTIASPSTHIDGIIQAAKDCDSCHGSGGVSAPPVDLDGATNSLAVGAHRTHLSGGELGRAVPCNECHRVPVSLDDPGHLDTARPSEVIFGPLSGLRTTPRWTTPTCQSTYCHAGLGASKPAPRWNVVNGTEAACGGCHGIPPNTPEHAAGGDCNQCHLPTAGANQTIANRATHGDGTLQATTLDCKSCHGDTTSPAPPLDLDGQGGTADPQVGAHRAHLIGGSFSAPVPCNACHRVPTVLDQPGHVDSARPSEVLFSGRATAALTTPSYSAATRTCSDTYCHGARSSGGTNPDPVWNASGTAPCGSCHGLPPATPHPQFNRCEVCHSAVAGASQTIVSRARHGDGVEDVDDLRPCQTCHGSSINAAPPIDLAGATVGTKVGAHQAHLAGTGESRAVPCSECHLTVSPTTPNQAGHYDSAPPAEITFGPLSRTGGHVPTKSGSTCNNTYCHGQGIAGSTTPNPTWTQGSLACTACHGMPPPDPDHGGGTATQCERCHTDTAGVGQSIIDPSRHVDGIVQTSEGCDACHGSGGSPVPPKDLAGLTVSAKVGAHVAHARPTTSAPVACGDCHLVPSNYGSPGHADTAAPAEVIFAGLARRNGVTPSYATAQMRCSTTYCHGASLPDGPHDVRWNLASPGGGCADCHGMPPASPAHSAVTDANGCNLCHADVAGSNQSIIAPSLHVDGVVQASGGGCDSCHGSPPTPANQSYSGGGGAHLAHASTLGFECKVCHGHNGSGPNHNQAASVVRTNVQLVFDTTTAFPGGTTMRNNQANATYTVATQRCAVGCHNPIVGNPAETPALTNTITWTGTAPRCIGCHDAVAVASPRNHIIATDADCLTCHTQTVHTQGTSTFRDPDAGDSFAYSSASPDGLCKTCHDGAGGTAFGNRAAANVSAFWNGASHGAQGIACGRCHAYHGSTNGPLLEDRASASCMAAGCHDDLATAFAQVNGTLISHHRIEGGTGVAVNCNDCHNAHVSRPHPLAAVDPDSRYTLMSLPDDARTKKISAGGDYRAFCLRCHDATPPAGVLGAKNIASVLAGGSETTMFRKGSDPLHRVKHGGWNCQACHQWHGTNGTQGINRGRMLLNYMIINQFSASTGYSNKDSCSTPNIPGATFRCH